MDVRYINPFCESITQLFKTMLETDVTLGKPSISREDVSADASAVIGFSGDAVGCVVLCFPLETAVKTASAFAGDDVTGDDECFSDALGELANIVAGQAKAKMEHLNITISLPCVIMGKKTVVMRSKQAPRLIIPCESRYGPFAVEVAMTVAKTAASQKCAVGAAASC